MILPPDFTMEKYGLLARFVDERDAEFILLLRTDEELGRWIHSTDNDLEKQKLWLRDYKKREREGLDYYFIFYKDGNPVGLNRLYHIEGTTFTTGSWIFDKNAPMECSIAASIMVRELAFEQLGLTYEHAFDGVHVNNKKVIRFNHMMGLKDLSFFEDVKGTYIEQSLTPEDFAKHKPRMLKLIGYK